MRGVDPSSTPLHITLAEIEKIKGLRKFFVQWISRRGIQKFHLKTASRPVDNFSVARKSIMFTVKLLVDRCAPPLPFGNLKWDNHKRKRLQIRPEPLWVALSG